MIIQVKSNEYIIDQIFLNAYYKKNQQILTKRGGDL